MSDATRERLAGLAAFAVPLIVYTITAHRFVGFWDVGEMDTVPYILGIAHPPGFPLYTMLGWAFAHTFAVVPVAFRMSLFSAVLMSGASYCVYAIACQLQRARGAAFFAAVLFAFGPVAWNVATRADVHALAALAYAGALLAWIRWYRQSVPRRLYLAAAVFGLAVAAHPIGLFLLPAMLVLVVSRLHDIDYAPLALASAIGVACACAPFLYLPLRSAAVTASALDPSASLGLPGGAFWDFDHPAVAANFMQLAFARDVDVGSALHGYESDAFSAGLAHVAALTVTELAVAGMLIAVVGAVLALRSQRQMALALLCSGIAPAVCAATFADESDISRYVLPLFVVLSVFSGYAVASLRGWRRFIARAGIVVCCALLLVSQARRVRDAGDQTALMQTHAILARTPDDAILVADWTLAPPLAYDAYVNHGTGHRTVLADWYGEIGNVVGSWPSRRPVFVVGTPEGSVEGFRLERLSAYPSLYRVERTAIK